MLQDLRDLSLLRLSMMMCVCVGFTATRQNGGADLLTYAYDKAGRVNVSDNLGTSSLFYDARGLLSRTQDPFGNFTAALGIPTLDGLGPDGGGAHADSEHLLIDSWLQRTVLLQQLVERL